MSGNPSLWKRLKKWPKKPVSWLGLPEGTETFCHNLFEKARFRFEVLDIGEGEREIRIPARPGELFPVNVERWGWIGPGGHQAKKVIKLLGNDAYLSGQDINASEKDVGNRTDEIQIDFPVERLLEVAKLVKVYKRPRRTPKGITLRLENTQDEALPVPESIQSTLGYIQAR